MADHSDPPGGLTLPDTRAPADAGGRAPDVEALPPLQEPRYARLKRLGEGGMGEVWRVQDRVLDRAVAMKILRPEIASQGRLIERFLREARLTAWLQHPGIIPIHDMGRLADGRVAFTMAEVSGRTLQQVLARERWPLQRLVDSLLRAAETVAYAHANGVLHRDIKPANIMIGPFGEVYVLDWGIARRQGDPEPAVEIALNVPLPSPASPGWTREGDVLGTPAYMPPEQAAGRHGELSPAADVYALGVTLREILGSTTISALASAPGGGAVDDLQVGPLRRLAEQATDPDPARRPPDGQALAEAVRGWLEGAQRREQALALVQQADGMLPDIHRRRIRAAAMRAVANERLAGIPPWSPLEEKRDAWALQDEAAGLEQAALQEEMAWTRVLHAALQVDPRIGEAHDRLADHYRALHADAEHRRDAEAAARAEALLREHGGRRHAAWLRGEGALTLVTDPPGAEALLHAYKPVDRRLEPIFVRSLGSTPLVDVSLPMGSYLVKLRAPGREEVLYPVVIGRDVRWSGAPPGESQPRPVLLPRARVLPEGARYVPAGLFLRGGAGLDETIPRRWQWSEGFLIQRDPVTNADYLRFLNALVDSGRAAEARAWAPQALAADSQTAATHFYHQDDRGRFSLGRDSEGDLWLPDWPVIFVSLEAANAYAAWHAQETDLPWRVPTAAEWEKAARGVDGRTYPWGDFLDPTWCSMRRSRPGRPLLHAVGDYPIDESPYGVRGMAGNASDWTSTLFHERPGRDRDERPSSFTPLRLGESPNPTLFEVRGGHWNSREAGCQLGVREGRHIQDRTSTMGFRLVCSFP